MMNLKEWLDRMPGDMDPDDRLMLIATALDAYRSELTLARNAATYVTGEDQSTKYMGYLSEVAEDMAADIRGLAREGLR